MKTLVSFRKVDLHGRVVLPMSIRKRFKIGPNDHLEIAVEGDCIILRKYQPICIYCGSVEGVSKHNNRNVCRKCLGSR